MSLIRLFNEPAGQDYLAASGVPAACIQQLPLLGISGIANLIAAIKFSRYFELTERDVIFTVFTDSMDLYTSRLEELRAAEGPYTREHAIADYHRHLRGVSTDFLLELTQLERKRIHHLKYYTWIEQQGRRLEELQAQWYDYPDYWLAIQNQIDEIDRHIEAFNARVAGPQA